MKDRKTFTNYGKEVLSFGRYKEKLLEILLVRGDYGYVVWLNDNVSRITVPPSDYNYCKRMVNEEQAIHEAIMESDHGDWGNRD